MQTITLITRLKGAERQEVQTWSLSLAVAARNLRKAINELVEERRYNANCYGDVDCGETWLEIDGVKFDEASHGNLESYSEAGRVLCIYSGKIAAAA
jgi:hypothetical protein